MFEGVADVRWMDRGNCMRLPARISRSVMFPATSPRTTEVAKAVCRSCPVLETCRAYHDQIEGGRRRNDLLGVVAGESVLERVTRRRAVSA